jgi:hypothetical protein
MQPISMEVRNFYTVGHVPNQVSKDSAGQEFDSRSLADEKLASITKSNGYHGGGSAEASERSRMRLFDLD